MQKTTTFLLSDESGISDWLNQGLSETLLKRVKDQQGLSSGEGVLIVKDESSRFNLSSGDIEKYPLRIFISRSIDKDLLVSYINNGMFHTYIDLDSTDEASAENILREKLNSYAESVEALKAVRAETATSRTELANLSKEVADSSEEISDSNKKIEEQISSTRKLVRFIKEMSTLVAIEELLNLLRKEIKHFHHIKSPILAYDDMKGSNRLLYFQGSQVTSKKTSELWKTSARLRLNDQDDQMYLANQFTRPFGKTLAIPLIVSEVSSDKNYAVLFFEHDKTKEDLDEFINFISERLQPLSVALDRVLLEAALLSSSQQWELTFDSISDPICLVDIDYNLLRANKSFGHKSFESKCFKVFYGRDSPCEGCNVVESMKKGKPQMGRVQKGERVYELFSYPIRLFEDGVMTTAVNHYRDITTNMSLQSQIIQNEKMTALGHLAGHIAHELNNPLTGIRSLAQLSSSEEDVPQQIRDDLQEVEKAAARCQKIIINLLEFSSDEGRAGSEFSDLNDLVDKTLPLLKSSMRYLNCETLLANEELKIAVEPQLFQQVIFNLANNACQALGESGTLKIETRRESKEIVALVIADDGPGIPQDLIDRVFDPFFTTKKEGEGTGLGLSFVKKVVESQGGEIKLKSEVGQGTEFKILLRSFVEK